MHGEKGSEIGARNRSQTPLDGPHAVLWQPDLSITDLGTLPGALFKLSVATGINKSGQIVGYSSTAGGFGSPHAVRWEPDGTIIDLGTFPGGTTSRGRRQ